ncbi:MAG: TonB-dependent receptor, partial [Ignavibacteria bacterium]|nr:TonB-dependent receptor [Ignavibacteria bacterium]
IGSSFENDYLILNFNLYYMLFENEIVKNGKVDRFGQPITGNVDETTHTGAEVSVVLKLFNGLEIFGNASYSKNKITSGVYFINDTETIDISGNTISGFPSFLFNTGLQYQIKNFFLKLNGKYVGQFYSDNFDKNISSYLIQFPGFLDYNDNINDDYFVMDIYGSYDLRLFNGLTNSKIFIQVNNVFDNLYSAYAIGKEYFPAADRNFIAGLSIGL